MSHRYLPEQDHSQEQSVVFYLQGASQHSAQESHGKRLQSIGFVTSILPYIFFTWWVNNDIEQQNIAKA